MSQAENLDIFTLLIELGSEIDLVNTNQETLLINSLEKEYYLFAEILIQKKAKINFTKKNGDSPLHIAVNKKCRKIIELLIKNNADLNLKNNK